VFAKAKEKIKALSDADFERLAISLLKRAKPDGDEDLIVPGADRARYTPQLIASMNAALGERGRLTLSKESGEFEGGYILRKGPRKDDMSLARVLAGLREELEPEIVGILFGDKGAKLRRNCTHSA
jgi:vacuolar-type H+-ATPase subunit E/Vma4